MTAQVLILVLAMSLSNTATGPQPSEAARTITTYLSMPHPENGHSDEARSQRLEVLSALKSMPPDDAADAVAQALPQAKDPRQRRELAEALGQYVQTPKSAGLLCELLKDQDAQVRWEAIHGLRMLARRTSRMGARRVGSERTIDPKDERSQPLVEFAPKVEGLVPRLVTAAGDEVEVNRICALYALVDSRDPLAVAELRRRLKDRSEKVRFHAACFLTEYQDASGLPEMQAALTRLQRPNTGPDDDADHYFQAEALLAAFERITGKSFGRIPLNPLLSSNTRQQPLLREDYAALLATWTQWWAWEPPGRP